jgi:hypothetical protein
LPAPALLVPSALHSWREKTHSLISAFGTSLTAWLLTIVSHGLFCLVLFFPERSGGWVQLIVASIQEDWEEQIDEDSNRPYYVNLKTGESSWEDADER